MRITIIGPEKVVGRVEYWKERWPKEVHFREVKKAEITKAELTIRLAQGQGMGITVKLLIQYKRGWEEIWTKGFFKLEETALQEAKDYCFRNGVNWSKVKIIQERSRRGRSK